MANKVYRGGVTPEMMQWSDHPVYTPFDEYRAAIGRAITNHGDARILREWHEDLLHTTDKDGNEDREIHFFVKVCIPAFDPDPDLEFTIDLRPGGYIIPGWLPVGFGGPPSQKAQEKYFRREQLTTAIENELVEAKRVLASRGTMPTQASDATPDTQSPAPTDVPKMTKWTRDQKIAFAVLVFTILMCIAAWLVVPEVREVILSFVRGVISTWTPTLVSPTPIP